jgi:hypothetical protein
VSDTSIGSCDAIHYNYLSKFIVGQIEWVLKKLLIPSLKNLFSDTPQPKSKQTPSIWVRCLRAIIFAGHLKALGCREQETLY